jgi:oligopeptidase B
VQDADSGQPLAYANLWLTNSATEATTDEQGMVNCKRPEQSPKVDTLLVSYVGYSTSRVLLNFPIDSVLVVPLSNGIELATATVTNRKPLPPRKIVKLAIKAAADNYGTEARSMYGFYRETAQENEQYVQLTEASVGLYYTGYPHPKLDRKQWEPWYFSKKYAFDIEADMVEDNLLNDFNAPEDQMEILQKRTSNYTGEIGVDVAMIDGPLGLTKYDKIKYRYDFLRPKLLSKYSYVKEGVQIVNGTLCHVIRFQPAQSDRKFSSDQSRKNNFAIYYGLLYIDTETYAVTRFEYALANERNYGFFNRVKAWIMRIEVDYKRVGDKWQLDHIKEVKTNRDPITNRPTRSKRSKELWITNTQPAFAPIPEERTFTSTRYSAVRFAEVDFDTLFWDTTSYLRQFPLSPKLVQQLSTETPLQQQFESFGKVQDLPLPVLFSSAASNPTLAAGAKDPYIHPYKISDPYQWTSQPEGEAALLSYLKLENKYARNYFISDKDAQRRFFTKLNEFYLETETATTSCREGIQRVEEDSLRGKVMYYCDSDSSQIELLALDRFEETLSGNWIMQVRPNEHRSLLSVAHKVPGSLSSTIALVKPGTLTVLDSILDVWDHRWVNDSTILYVRTNDRKRGNKLYLHQLGISEDRLLLEEQDETFDLNLAVTDKQILVYTQSMTQNAWYWYQDSTAGKITLVLPLKPETNYELIKAGSKWYRLDMFQNTLSKTKSLTSPTWKPVDVPTGLNVQSISATKDFLILEGLNNAVKQLHILRLGTSTWTMHPVADPTDDLSVSISNTEQNEINIYRSNLATPWQGQRYRLPNTLVESIPTASIRDSFSLRGLRVKRLSVKARDGARIPVTTLRYTNTSTGSAGIFLKVYGAYGAVDVPSFSATDALLALRGFTVVYAHVRGTSVLGADWYKQGRTDQKLNSMYDYIDVARYVKRKTKKDPAPLIGYGQSAGGLIVAWAANEHPSLFESIILDHPFLDVLNIMMNPDLPLVTGEYKEWGDPRSADVFSYIRQYDPYQNIRPQAYPNILVIAGLLDQQTPIDQQAKYVAAVRDANTGDAEILLLTDLNSGHAGSRDEALRHKLIARMFSFMKESVK